MVSCKAAQEQVPTFNLKNKSDRQIVMVVGTQNIVKPTVVMRIKNQDGRSTEYGYTVSSSIVLDPNDTVSLYGLNIEEVQALDFYCTMNNQNIKLETFGLSN